MATFKHLPTASLTRLGLALVKGGYRFSYDKCNRLTDAEYSENDSHEECQNYYDESIQKYDANGNIGSLVVRNGMPDMYLFAGGYYKYQSSDDTAPSSGNSTGDLYFYNYDHLGNVREVVNEDGKLLQVTNYYLFGAPYSDNRITSMNPKLQPYKFTGKELDLVHGLNTYDHGARQNYSILGVWDRVDPLAEKYYNISPYAVCGNNPICYSDYNGEIIDTTEISGENLSSYNNMINDLRSHSNLFDELYQYLQKSDQVIKVNYVNNLQDKDNPIDGCFDPVSWTVKFNDSNRNIPSITFTEEFFHAFQQLNLSQYNGPFNREFEAKIFSTCAEMTLNVPIANYDGMTNFQNNIIFGAYGNGDVPITPTSVSSKSFLDEYKAASDYWAGYNVAHNHGNDYYKIFNMSNPFSLQKIIKLTYENH